MAYAKVRDWTTTTRWRADWWNEEQAAYRVAMGGVTGGLTVSDLSGSNKFDLPNLAQPNAITHLNFGMGRTGVGEMPALTSYAVADKRRTLVLIEHRILTRPFAVESVDFDVYFEGLSVYDLLSDFSLIHFDLVTESPSAIRPDLNIPYSGSDDAGLFPESSILTAPLEIAPGGSNDNWFRCDGFTAPGVVQTVIPVGTKLKLIATVASATAATMQLGIEIMSLSIGGYYPHTIKAPT